jgi:PAS domain S-box-containing protein
MSSEQHNGSVNLTDLLLNSISDYAIYSLDPDGNITSWNPGITKIKGYTAEEIIGSHFSRFYTIEDRAAGKPQRLLGQALAAGRVEDEGWSVRKDGSRFWAWIVITPMRDGAGNRRGFAKVTRDLSERKRSEETRLRLAQLQEAARIREEFLAYISHEMRNPLNSLKLQIELVRRQNEVLSALPDKVIERLSHSYTRLAALVDQVLEHSRIQAGRAVVQWRTIDMSRVVDEIAAELRPEAEQKGLSLKVSVPAEQLTVPSDADFLRVILRNLIGNAIKFANRGAIEVALSFDTNEYRISVQDTGPGIAAEDQARIFEPFERVESLENKHVSGFGLGLAACKRLVEALGGRIELESELGAGSLFRIVLPRDANVGIKDRSCGNSSDHRG